MEQITIGSNFPCDIISMIFMNIMKYIWNSDYKDDPDDDYDDCEMLVIT